MAMQESPVSAEVVGNAFVGQYYKILHHSPELVHRFYQDSSSLSRPDATGTMATVTTMKASIFTFHILGCACSSMFGFGFKFLVSENFIVSYAYVRKRKTCLERIYCHLVSHCGERSFWSSILPVCGLDLAEFLLCKSVFSPLLAFWTSW